MAERWAPARPDLTGLQVGHVIKWDGTKWVTAAAATLPVAATEITPDSTHRFVTDTEKTTWNAKQAALVSGSTIKTVNGTSLLGSGNIIVEGGGGGSAEFSLNNTSSQPAKFWLPTDVQFDGYVTDDIADGVLYYKPGAYGATATATRSGNSVASIAVNAGGADYPEAPTVVIQRGSGDTTGAGAAAVANMSGGSVASITMTNGGSGYTVTPIVKIVGKTYKRQLDANGCAHVSWWSVYPNTNTDQQEAINQCLMDCSVRGITGVKFDAGTYQYTLSPIQRIPDPTTGRSASTAVSMYGTGSTYQGGTIFKCTNGMEAGLLLQRGKGTVIKDIWFQGMNTGVNWVQGETSEPTPNGMHNGVSNYTTAPHAGIAIDPFYTSGTIHKYPSAATKGYYNELYGNGSTAIRIINCRFSYWAVGISVSCGGMQNGEEIRIIDCAFEHCLSGISTGEAQNRSVFVQGYQGWHNILYHFNSVDHSPGGHGHPPIVDVFNLAGDTKWLCKLGNFESSKFMASKGHAEGLYGFGGGFSGRSNTSFKLTDSQIFFSAERANTVLQCNRAVFDHCELIFSIGAGQKYLSFQTTYLEFTNLSRLTMPVVTNIGRVFYNNCLFTNGGSMNELFSDMNATATQENQATYVQNVNTTTNTWTFENSQSVAPGDYVLLYPKTSGQLVTEFGQSNQYIGAGMVQSISGTTVTVTGLVNGLANGQHVDLKTIRFFLP